METILSKKGPKKDRYVSALLVLHGIRQAELARKLGVSTPFFSLVVQGKRGGTRKIGRAHV